MKLGRVIRALLTASLLATALPVQAFAVFDGFASIIVTVESITGLGSLDDLVIEAERFVDSELLVEEGTALGGSLDVSGDFGPTILSVNDSLQLFAAANGSVPVPVGLSLAFVATQGILTIENSSPSEFEVTLLVEAIASANAAVTDAANETSAVTSSLFLDTPVGQIFDEVLDADSLFGPTSAVPFNFLDTIVLTLGPDDEEQIDLSVSVGGFAESVNVVAKAPEPGTLALFLGALAIVQLRARRHSN